MPQTLYLLFFAANLAFILTNLYGWLLKWFYRSRAYSEEFGRMYLAQHLLNLLNKY